MTQCPKIIGPAGTTPTQAIWEPTTKWELGPPYIDKVMCIHWLFCVHISSEPGLEYRDGKEKDQMERRKSREGYTVRASAVLDLWPTCPRLSGFFNCLISFRGQEEEGHTDLLTTPNAGTTALATATDKRGDRTTTTPLQVTEDIKGLFIMPHLCFV